MAGAVATVQKVADGAMRAATPMVDDALAAIADAADGAAGAAADIGDAVNDWAYQQQLNRYRPVTKEVYQSPSFHLPNMIRIVDGNERRDIDVCRDAIGWLDNLIHKITIIKLNPQILEKCVMSLSSRRTMPLSIFCVR